MQQLVGWVETALKFGVLAGAAGYLSLRAHFNTFGIPALSNLGAERYVQEVYVLGVGIISRTLPVVFGFSLIATLVLQVARRFFPSTAERFRVGIGPADGVIALGLLAVLVIVAMQKPGVDLAVGLLHGNPSGGLREWVFDLLIMGVAAGILYLLLVPASAKEGGQTVWLRRSVVVLVALGVLAVPSVFGASVRGARYPLVMLRGVGAEPAQCGLALYQNDKVIFVWQAALHQGWVRLFDLTDIQRPRFGPIYDLRALIAMAAYSSEEFPQCVDFAAQ